MYVEAIQKCFELDGKKIAYCDVKIIDNNYSYSIRFDEKTKKRFNTFLKKNGFIIGEVVVNPPSLSKILMKGE